MYFLPWQFYFLNPAIISETKLKETPDDGHDYSNDQ